MFTFSGTFPPFCAVSRRLTNRLPGRASEGQLCLPESEGSAGDNATNATSPLCAAFSSPATMIAAGGYHTCVLLNDSSVQCWGIVQSGSVGGIFTKPSKQIRRTARPATHPRRRESGRSRKTCPCGCLCAQLLQVSITPALCSRTTTSPVGVHLCLPFA
jgi:hypothetical protein